jgi:hypothetical protein
VLDVFVKKDPNAIRALEQADGMQPTSFAALSAVADYGFPWDHFLRTNLLNDGFLHFPSLGGPQIFSVQSGAAWANMQQLRNFPIARLFVNEIGQLIFDDSLRTECCCDPAGDDDPAGRSPRRSPLLARRRRRRDVAQRRPCVAGDG